MRVDELRTGDRIEVKGAHGYITEALHCEHGMSRITSQFDGQDEPTTNAYVSDKEITSGLVVLESYVVEEVCPHGYDPILCFRCLVAKKPSRPKEAT